MKPRPRLVRWLVRAAIGIAAAFAVLFLAVHLIVTQTDVARSLIESRLSQRSGWRTHIGAASVGWLGGSILRDVEIWLPLEDRPSLTAPRLVVGHRALLAILLGRSTDIRSLNFERPTILIREDAGGRWNIQEAVQLWVDAAERRQELRGMGADLPRLDFDRGTLVIQRADGREARLPFSFSSIPRRADFAARLKIPGVLDADARVAPDAAWAHEAQIVLEDATPLAALFMDNPPSPITARGVWRATIRPGDIRGEAEINQLTFGRETAAGRLFLSTGGATTTLRAENLAIAGAHVPHPPVIVRAGQAAFPPAASGGGISVSGLVAEWLGTTITLDGSWNPGTRTGEARAGWSGASERLNIQQFGSLTVRAELPRAGLQSVSATLTARGRALGGRFNLAADATAAGPDWARFFRTTVDARTLTWTDAQGPIDLSGLSTTAIVRWPLVRLTELRAPPAEINTAAAEFNALTREWSAEIDLAGLTVPRAGVGQIAFAAEAVGAGASVSVPRLVIAADPGEFTASFAYDPRAPAPLAASVTLVAPPPAPVAAEPPPPQPTGTWTVDAQLEGSAEPLDLRARGHATGAGIALPGGPPNAVSIDWSGHADPGGTRIETDPFDFLGGLWALRGSWPAGGPPSARVGIENLPLDRVAEAANLPVQVGGVLMTELTLVAHDWRPEDLELTGRWSVENPRAGRYAVRSGRGTISSVRGRVSIHDILFSLDQGELGGSVSFNFAQANVLAIDAASRGWPLRVKGTDTALTVDGSAHATVDVLAATAHGSFDLATPITVGGVPYADARTIGRLRGRTLQVDDFHADLGGGQAAGTLTLPFDQWTQMDLNLVLTDLGVPELLAPWGGMSASAAEASGGAVSAFISAAPSASSRAVEPLRINIILTPEGASFRGVTLGDSQAVLYAGPGRVIMDDSFLNIAGGRVELWSRLSWHDGEPFLHTQGTVTDMNVDSLVGALQPGAAPIPGKITSQFSVGSYIFEPRRLFGRATVLFEEADLANIRIISALYSLLSFQPRDLRPTGVGRGTIRLEGYTLLISDLEYFNRGIDIAGSGRIEDLRMGGASPVSGVAVARIRPLRDLRVGLPLLSEVDELLAALQSGGASIVISGTVANREMRRASEREIREEARRAAAGTGP